MAFIKSFGQNFEKYKNLPFFKDGVAGVLLRGRGERRGVGLLWGGRASGWRRFGPWRTMLMMLGRLKLLLDHKIRLHPPLPTPSNDSCSRVSLPAPPNKPQKRPHQKKNNQSHQRKKTNEKNHQSHQHQRNLTRKHQFISPAEQHNLTRKWPKIAFFVYV